MIEAGGIDNEVGSVDGGTSEARVVDVSVIAMSIAVPVANVPVLVKLRMERKCMDGFSLIEARTTSGQVRGRRCPRGKAIGGVGGSAVRTPRIV